MWTRSEWCATAFQVYKYDETTKACIPAGFGLDAWLQLRFWPRSERSIVLCTGLHSKVIWRWRRRWNTLLDHGFFRFCWEESAIPPDLFCRGRMNHSRGVRLWREVFPSPMVTHSKWMPSCVTEWMSSSFSTNELNWVGGLARTGLISSIRRADGFRLLLLFWSSLLE